MVEPVAHAFSMWPARVALDVFDAYLDGTTAEECAARYLEQISAAAAAAGGRAPADAVALRALRQLTAGSPAMVRQDFAEQLGYFRTLEEDEEYFDAPRAFVADHGVPLPLDMRKELVARYYALDPAVVRHLFGLRLAKGEVDGVVHLLREATGEAVVRRTAENVRRAHRLLLNGYRQREGVALTPSTPCAAALAEHLQLRGPAARRYACVCFAAEHHLRGGFFARLPTDGLYALVEAIMESWCEPNRFHVAAPFTAAMAALGRALGDSRTLNDLRGHVLGVGPTPGLPALLAKLVPAASPTVPAPPPLGSPPPPPPAAAAGPPGGGGLSPPPTATPADGDRARGPPVTSRALDDFQATLRALSRTCRLLGQGDLSAALRALFLRLGAALGPGFQTPRPSRAPLQASLARVAASAAANAVALLTGGAPGPGPLGPVGLPGLDAAAALRLCAVIGSVGGSVQLWHTAADAAEADECRSFFLVAKLALTLLAAAAA